ncbi:MAG: rhamnulokinase, partial [Clostridia bacterium]|nr:rhamnulokinase [Clostridia bacterium]
MGKIINVLGFDFGASSGRAMLGRLENGKIELNEVHRFSNDPVILNGRFVWDVPRLFFEMKQALVKIANMGVKLDAIGVDTWGVDFGLIDKNGNLVSLPVHYRDHHTDGMMEKAFEILPKKDIFERTGLAFLQFNTLYQLLALKNDPAMQIADKMALMPDLLM